MTLVADFSFARIPAASLKVAGIVGVCRYTAPGGTSNGKVMGAAEFAELTGAGLQVALNYEEGTNDIGAGYQGGVAAAQWTETWARQIGYPAGWAVYYSVDESASGPAALPYFQGVRSVTGSAYRSRPYAGADVINAVVNAGVADCGWLTNAASWSQGQTSPFVSLAQQTVHNVTIPGVSSDQWDQNTLLRADWCVAGSVPPPTPQRKKTRAMILVSYKGAVYFTDGLYYRWVPDAESLGGIQYMLAVQGLNTSVIAAADGFIESGAAGQKVAGTRDPNGLTPGV